jgi:hypothetical protein
MNLPKNAHVSTHPCLQAKLSQLRSAKTGSRDAQALVHEIALMVGYEALGAGLKAKQDGTVRTEFVSLHWFPCIHLTQRWGDMVTIYTKYSYNIATTIDSCYTLTNHNTG